MEVKNLSLAEKEEYVALLESRLAQNARRSIFDYVKYVPVPGAPMKESEDCEEFYPDQVTPADHHLLILDTLQHIADGDIKRAIFMLPPGSAKALALDTPIPTPDGWKNMGDLKVGDRVFGDDGKQCNVTWVSPIWKNRPVYKVCTDCGDEIIADKEHEWLVSLDRKPRLPLKKNPDPRGRIPNPDRDNPKSKAKIKETWELAKRRAKRPMIFRASPLELPDKKFPIDPYLMGVWLGDGSSQSVRITSGTQDQPWLKNELNKLGYATSVNKEPRNFHVLGVRKLFIGFYLLNDPWHKTRGKKHIPQEYLRGSIKQRLSLLQGLVDTDGHISKNGEVQFTSTNRNLAEGVQELVRSLGAKASLSESRATLYGKDCGPVYRIHFFLSGAARMPRKAEKTRNGVRTPNTYVDASPAGVADTVCIEVDSPSHLFLCGRSMTPTHNSTYCSVVFPPFYMGYVPGSSIIAVSYGDTLAKKFGRKCRSVVRTPEFRKVFNAGLTGDNAAVDDWGLDNRSAYMCGGMLSGITGTRADGIVIDDPIKGREDADSEVVREKVWETYKSDLRTRLKPNGWIVAVATRWQEQDPLGMILPEDYDGRSGWVTARDGEKWYVLNIPAQCERDDDPLSREIGEYLWTDWFPVSYWEQEKITQGPRNWSALFQQRPSPQEGDYFKEEDIRWYDKLPPRDTLRAYMASDYAVTEEGEGYGDWTVHGCACTDPDDNLYIADWWRKRTKPDVWIDAGIDMADKWHPLEWAEEAGQIKKSIGPFLRKRLRERKVNVYRNPYPSVADKPTRAQSFRAMMNMGRVYFPKNAPWVADLISEMLAFPNRNQKDQVDVLGLFGRMLDRMIKGKRKATPPPVPIGIEGVTLERLFEDREKYKGDDSRI